MKDRRPRQPPVPTPAPDAATLEARARLRQALDAEAANEEKAARLRAELAVLDAIAADGMFWPSDY